MMRKVQEYEQEEEESTEAKRIGDLVRLRITFRTFFSVH